MKILVIGASSEIALSCIKLWANAGENTFVLAGRNADSLNAVRADLEIRKPGSRYETFHFQLDSYGIKDLSRLAFGGQFDLCLIAIGSNVNQPFAQRDTEYLLDELNTNGAAVVALAESVTRAFESQGYGTLGVVGSVAGDRGRAYNYVYGSAKSMVEKYTEGLQQRLSRTKVKVCLIKPGPTRSPLTVNHSARLADASNVAVSIVEGLSGGKPKIYAPSHWKIVMLIVRNIPQFIFRKMTF